MHVLPDDPITFKSLLPETTELDSSQDIVFHVSWQTTIGSKESRVNRLIFFSQVEDDAFPAHKYIIFSRAEGLRDIVKGCTAEHIYVNIEELPSKMFELILKYIYEHHELIMTDMEYVEASFDPYSGRSNLNIVREHVGKFRVAKFFDRLMEAQKDREPSMRPNRLSYPQLYDVTIKCTDQMEIKAHRYVLSTRLEYFNTMFHSSWSEATVNEI